MAWYAAHIVSYAKFKDGNQDRFPLWENIVLIEAETDEKAFANAELTGRDNYDDTIDEDSGNMTVDDRPAYWVFAGVRKLSLCTPVASIQAEADVFESDPDFKPGHGTEVTYLELELRTQEELTKFVEGQSVTVLYEK